MDTTCTYVLRNWENMHEGEIFCSNHCMSIFVGIISMDMMCTYFLKHWEKMHSRAGRQTNERDICGNTHGMSWFVGIISMDKMDSYTLNHWGKMHDRVRRQINEADICGSVHCQTVSIVSISIAIFRYSFNGHDVHLRAKALREYAWLGRKANKLGRHLLQ